MGTPADLKGAYTILKRWYTHSSGRQPHLSFTDLDKVSGDYKELYWRELPSSPGIPFTIHAGTFSIGDLVLAEEEVDLDVLCLPLVRALT